MAINFKHKPATFHLPRPIYLVGAGLTALWLLIVWIYVAAEVGWGNLFYSLPHEIALFFAAVAVPAAFLWLVIAFVEVARRNRINRETLFDLAHRMAEMNPKVQEEAQSLSAEITKQIDNLGELSKIAEETRGNISQMGAEADLALSQATERTSVDAATIRATYDQYVTDVARTADEAAQRIATAIGTSIADNFTEDLQATAVKLEAESVTIANAASDFAERIEGIESLLDSHHVRLAEATSRAATQAGEMQAAFGAQSQELSDTAEILSQKTEQIHNAFEQQIALLKHSVETIVAQIETLDQRSVVAGRKVEAIGTSLRRLIDETIETEVSRVGTATDEAGKQVRALATEVSQTLEAQLDDQIEKMKGAGADLDRDISGLNATLRESTKQLEGLVRTTADQAQQTVKLFHEQVEELSTATREAADQADAVREAVSQGRRDAFLRASTTVIKELNELAVDIDQVFEPSMPENVMQLYQDGDLGIFVRRIARSHDEHSVPRIRDRMRKDSGFRTTVQTFMKRYEGLLAQTTECDPDRILTATLLTADVGKVYMLLARASQRDH
jgi:hypothetical protein